jgi:hypothetical protein
MRYFLALIALSLMFPSRAAAQGPVQIFPGDRVRLTAPDCQLEKQPATFVAFEDNLISATAGERTIQCPLGALTKLEVSLGDRIWQRDAVRGMKYGALFGLAGGVAVMASAGREEDSAVVDAMLVTAGAGALGFLIGAGISAMREGEEWLEAPLPSPRPSFALEGRGRVHIGFSIPVRD